MHAPATVVSVIDIASSLTAGRLVRAGLGKYAA
jgi:hypothetical protein